VVPPSGPLFEVAPLERSEATGDRWLIKASVGPQMRTRWKNALAGEAYGCLLIGRGTAVKKREDTHQNGRRRTKRSATTRCNSGAISRSPSRPTLGRVYPFSRLYSRKQPPWHANLSALTLPQFRIIGPHRTAGKTTCSERSVLILVSPHNIGESATTAPEHRWTGWSRSRNAVYYNYLRLATTNFLGKRAGIARRGRNIRHQSTG